MSLADQDSSHVNIVIRL